MSLPIGIGLGSNLGERLLNLQRARSMIVALPGVLASAGQVGCLSAPVFESDPVECPPGSKPFLNTVIEIALRDRCSPIRLLTALRQIESSLGRPSRHPRNAPRTIDLDILYAGTLRLQTPELCVPHPRLHLRRFVLAPLAALRPALLIPGLEKSAEALLQALDDPAKVLLHQERW